MAQRKPSLKITETEYMSDDDSSDEEIDPRLITTPEEREYGTVPGSAQVTQAALAYTQAQTNPTVECGPPRQNTSRNQQQDRTETKLQKGKTNKKVSKFIINNSEL